MGQIENIKKNLFSRKWGTTTDTAVDIFLGGKFGIMFAAGNISNCFENIESFLRGSGGTIRPEFLEGQVYNANGLDKSTMPDVLAALCKRFTPPSKDLMTTETAGMGNIKFTSPTNLEISNEFTATFLEMSGCPVATIFGAWQNMIMDPILGVTPMSNASPRKPGYSTNVLYWLVKPDGVTVEKAMLFAGAYPTTDPISLFQGDVSNTDQLEIDISFKYDYLYDQSFVYNLAQTVSTSRMQNGFNALSIYKNATK